MSVIPQDDDFLSSIAKITGNKALMPLPKDRVKSSYDDLIVDSANRHGVDPDFVRALTNQESTFKPNATSPKGASGLMQLMPDTARTLGVKDIYDPKQNIEGGTKYLRQQLDKFGGDVDLALAAYNAGPGAVEKYGNKIPPYRETQDYVKKIRGNYKGNGYAAKADNSTTEEPDFLTSIQSITKDIPQESDFLSEIHKITGGTQKPLQAPGQPLGGETSPTIASQMPSQLGVNAPQTAEQAISVPQDDRYATAPVLDSTPIADGSGRIPVTGQQRPVTRPVQPQVQQPVKQSGSVNFNVDPNDPGVQAALAAQAADPNSANLQTISPTQEPREVGTTNDNLQGIAGEHIPQNAKNARDAAIEAIAAVGRSRGITPQQAAKYVDSLKAPLQGDWKPGEKLGVSYQTIADIQGEAAAKSGMAMEQAQNRIPGTEMNFQGQRTNSDGSVTRSKEVPSFGDFVDQILGERTPDNELTAERQKAIDARQTMSPDDEELNQTIAKAAKDPMIGPSSQAGIGFATTALEYLSALGAGASDIGDKIPGGNILSATMQSVFGKSLGDVLGKFSNRAEEVNKLSTPDHWVYKLPRTIGNVAGALPAYAVVDIATGGNPVVTFGATDALMAQGKGKSKAEVAGAGFKGGTMGVAFGGFSRFGKGAADILLGEEAMPAVFNRESAKALTDATATRRIQSAMRILERDTTPTGEATAAQKMVDRELEKSGLTIEDVMGKPVPKTLREKVVNIFENASGKVIARKIVEQGVPIGLASGTGYGMVKAEGGSEEDAVTNALLFGAMQGLSAIFHKEPNEPFTPEEVAKADGATMRVPDEKGKPRDLMLTEENGQIRVTDVTDKVPPGTVQAAVLPKPTTPEGTFEPPTEKRKVRTKAETEAEIKKSSNPLHELVDAIPEGAKGKGFLKQTAEMLDEADSPIKVLNAIQRGRTRIANMPESEQTSAIGEHFNELEQSAKDQGFEIQDLLGHNFVDGMTVEAEFVDDPSIPVGEERIVHVRQPQVLKDGELVQHAKVTVGKNDNGVETYDQQVTRINKENAKIEKANKVRAEIGKAPEPLIPLPERPKTEKSSDEVANETKVQEPKSQLGTETLEKDKLANVPTPAKVSPVRDRAKKIASELVPEDVKADVETTSKKDTQQNIGVEDVAKIALEPPKSILAKLTYGNEKLVDTDNNIHQITSSRGREYNFNAYTYDLADGRKRVLLSTDDPEGLVDAGAVIKPTKDGVVIETLHKGVTGFDGLGGVLARYIKRKFGKIVPEADAPLSTAGKKATEKLAKKSPSPPVEQKAEKGKEPWELTRDEYLQPFRDSAGYIDSKIRNDAEAKYNEAFQQQFDKDKTQIPVNVLKENAPFAVDAEQMTRKEFDKHKGSNAEFQQLSRDVAAKQLEANIANNKARNARSLGNRMKTQEQFQKVATELQALKTRQSDFHRNALKQALSEGKPVPSEVLADYPDLAPKKAEQPKQSPYSIKQQEKAEARKAAKEKPKTDIAPLPESQQVSVSAEPSVTETKASVKTEKVNPRTGLTETQTEFLASALRDAVHKGLDAQGLGSADGQGAKAYLATFKDDPLPSNIVGMTKVDMPDFIKIPGDGSFRVENVGAANKLHQRITGKPIEGISGEKNASMPSIGVPEASMKPPSLGKPSKQRMAELDADQKRLEEAYQKGENAEVLNYKEARPDLDEAALRGDLARRRKANEEAAADIGASIEANLPPDAHRPEVAEKLAEEAVTRFDEAKQSEVPQNNDYYLFDNQKKIYKPVDATAITIPNVEGDFYLHRGGLDGKHWSISEGKTGSHIATEKTKAKTIESAEQRITKLGIDKFNASIDKWVDDHGISPRYKDNEESNPKSTGTDGELTAKGQSEKSINGDTANGSRAKEQVADTTETAVTGKPDSTSEKAHSKGDEGTLDFRSGDKVKDEFGRRGVVAKRADGELHIIQDKTQARLPVSDKWSLIGKRPVEVNGFKAGDTVTKKGIIGRVYERGGQLRVKWQKDGTAKSEALSDKWTKTANPEAGAISPDLLTLGLNKTISEDVAPGIRRVGQGLKDARDDIKKFIFAGNRGEAAKLASTSLRAETGKMARSALIAEHALKAARKYFSKNPIEDNYDFIAHMEGGNIAALPPDEQPAAQELRRLLDDARQRVQDLGTGKLEEYIENYFPHIWNDPKKAASIFAKTLSKRPFEGSKSFLKQRVYNTFEEGLDAGLTPVSDNPVDLALLKIRDMDRYVAAHNAINYLKDKGLAQFVQSGKPIPDGFIKINDKISEVRYKNDDGELVTAGHLYAAEPAARVINNYLSPGLSGSEYAILRDGFKAWRYAGNLMNQAQLGLSAFHAAFTTVDVIISKTALGLNQLASGHPIEAAKSFAGTPIAPITNLIRGDKIYREGLTPGSTDAFSQAMAGWVAEAGGRFKMDDFYHTKAAQKMSDAFKRGNILGGIMRTPSAILDVASHPLMNWLVPRQKLGIFADLMRHELKRLGPDATVEQIRGSADRIWDSVDNRMGQLVYDNLFWNKTIKDLSMASVRSVGWNLGSIRELGGAAKDVVTIPARVKRAYKDANRETPIITERMAYAAALPLITGILGAFTMYLMSGKKPEELKDYFFPQTGNVDENGNPERLSLPTYMKDVYAYSKHPGRTLSHKTHPLIAMISEMLTNKDYYGTEIRNSDDPYIQQLEDVAKHVGKGFVPFGVQGLLKEKERQGTTASKVLPFFGFTPAPKELNNTDAEDLLSEIQASHREVGSRTKAAAERSKELSDLTRSMKKGNDITAEFQKAKAAGILVDKDLSTIIDRTKTTYLEAGVKRLTLEDALDVYEVANESERGRIADEMTTKIRNARKAKKVSDAMSARIDKIGLK